MTATPTFLRTLQQAFEDGIQNMHVAMPATVLSYDNSDQSVTVQPSLKGRYIDEDGVQRTEDLPPITGVPVVFPGGGGFRVTFPVQAGDSVLLVFSEASIDNWLSSDQSEVDPDDDRRFALSDAVAIPGLRSFRNPLSSAPTTNMSIGKDGGTTIVIADNEIQAGGTSALATKADIDALRLQLNTHIHSGGTISGNTGPPSAMFTPAQGTTVLKGG